MYVITNTGPSSVSFGDITIPPRSTRSVPDASMARQSLKTIAHLNAQANGPAKILTINYVRDDVETNPISLLPSEATPFGSSLIQAMNADAANALLGGGGGGGGDGTVTSVALTLPGIFTVAGSPITTSGTLAATLTNQTAGTVFAAPSGGGAPVFRALAATDVPALDAAKITSGTIGVARGGTGAATLTGYVKGNGTGVMTASATIPYADIAGAPAPYTLPIASATVVGGVKQGTGVTISADGTISASGSSYTLPVATTTVLGGVLASATITVSGTGALGIAANYVAPSATKLATARYFSITGAATTSTSIQFDGSAPVALEVTSLDATKLTGTVPSASVPIATASALGGVKAGSGVTISADGTLSASGGSGYTLPAATTTVLGGVKIGGNINVTADGTISVAAPFTLPTASATVLGGIRVPAQATSNLVLNAGTGALSVPQADRDTLGVIRVGDNLDIQSGVLTVAPPTGSYVGGVKAGTGISIDSNGVLTVSSVDPGLISGTISAEVLPYASQAGGGILQRMHDPVQDFSDDPPTASDLNTILNILRDSGVLAPST